MQDKKPPREPITLGDSEERFRLLVESVQDYAIFILSPSGIISSWNSGAQRMKGYTAEEILGKHFSVFYEPETVAMGHPENELAIAAEEGRYEEEGWRVRKDGSRFWANVVITALRDNKGDLTGYAKVTRDMSDRRVAAELLERRVQERTTQLAATNRRIEGLNRRLVQAMRETHHRVKNNLQVVSALIDLQIEAHQGSGGVPLSEMERLRNHIRTLATVHNLLTASAHEDEADQSISAKGLLGTLVPLLQETSGAARIDYEIEDVEVAAKQGVALALIVNELISNSSRHGGKEIRATLRVTEGRACLQVSDNGPGFPPGFNPAIHSNLGLDLICSLASADLGGDIRFENKEGNAVVTLTFPVNR